MNAVELRSLTSEELQVKLNDLKAELFNLRFSHATGSLANPMALNVCKKNIAKVQTILRERELNIRGAKDAMPVAVAKTKKSTTAKKVAKKR